MSENPESKNWKCVWHTTGTNSECTWSNKETGQTLTMCNTSCKGLYEMLKLTIPIEITNNYTGLNFINKSIKSLFSHDEFNPVIPIFYPFKNEFVTQIKTKDSDEQKSFLAFLKNDDDYILKTMNFVIISFKKCTKGDEKNLQEIQRLVFPESLKNGLVTKGILYNNSPESLDNINNILSQNDNIKLIIPMYDNHGSILYIKKHMNNINIFYIDPLFPSDTYGHRVNEKIKESILRYDAKYNITHELANDTVLQGKDSMCCLWSFFSGIMCLLNDSISINVIYKNIKNEKTRYFIIYLFLYNIYKKIKETDIYIQYNDIQYYYSSLTDVVGDIPLTESVNDLSKTSNNDFSFDLPDNDINHIK